MEDHAAAVDTFVEYYEYVYFLEPLSLRAPLYVGLIIVQTVYVYHFMVELVHLVSVVRAMFETDIMLVVPGLIDVVMIANLLIMVIVRGYETFVFRLKCAAHPDEAEWLSHVNAGILKIKLALALIGMSSIRLLKTFINALHMELQTHHVASDHPSDFRGLGIGDGLY